MSTSYDLEIMTILIKEKTEGTSIGEVTVSAEKPIQKTPAKATVTKAKTPTKTDPRP